MGRIFLQMAGGIMGNKYKIVLWGFFSLDYKAMETYLEQMAEKGWMLEKVGRFTAKFRAIAPQRLRFYVDVFQDGGPLAAENHQDVEEYRQLCEESGWQFITSQDYLQFFFVPADKNTTPLQTDEVIEQKIVETTLWRTEVASVLIFFVIFFLASRSIFPLNYRNFLTFTGTAITFLLPLLGIPMLLWGIYLLVWMLKARKNIKWGLPLAKSTLRNARMRTTIFYGPVFILSLFICIALIADSFFRPYITVVAILPALLGGAIGLLLRNIIKKKTDSKSEGFRYIIIGLLAMVIVVHVIVPPLIMQISSTDKGQETLPTGYPIITTEELVANSQGVVVGRQFKPGMSPVVPRHYDYWEIGPYIGDKRGAMRINYYETKHPYFAQLIFAGKSGEILRWSEKLEQDWEHLWDVDALLLTKGRETETILLRKGNRVVYLEGDMDFNAQYMREMIVERFFG
jgi:hypothetical protein